MGIAEGPESRTIPMPPRPGGVEMATIVSVSGAGSSFAGGTVGFSVQRCCSEVFWEAFLWVICAAICKGSHVRHGMPWTHPFLTHEPGTQKREGTGGSDLRNGQNGVFRLHPFVPRIAMNANGFLLRPNCAAGGRIP